MQLVDGYLLKGLKPVDAVKAALPKLRGAFALGFVFAGEDDLMIGARKGAPLAIGYGDKEMYLGSDAIALSPFTDSISYLEDGDWVVMSRSGRDRPRRERRDRPAARCIKSARRASWSTRPTIATSWRRKSTSSRKSSATRWRTISTWRPRRSRCPMTLPFDFAKLDRISISACGTACIAGQIAKYWFERLARLPVDIDIASEFRYREAPLKKGDLAIFISQSGETADTLAALRYAKEQGQHILSIVNVPSSTIARESHIVMPTLGGTGDRRCVDQGIHLSADRAGVAGDRRGPRAWRAVGGR